MLSDIYRGADGCYGIDGRRLISVTTVLAAAGLSNFDAVPERIMGPARRRGTGVHEAIADHSLFGAAYEVPEEHAGYMRSWELYREKYGVVPVLVETPVYDLELGYAGTLDCLVVSAWPAWNVWEVVDVKTGPIPKTAAVQLSAYVPALRKTFGMKSWPGRVAVQVMKDGSMPRVRPYPASTMLSDFQIFKDALRKVQEVGQC